MFYKEQRKKEKETQINYQLRVSANRPSENWALVMTGPQLLIKYFV